MKTNIGSPDFTIYYDLVIHAPIWTFYVFMIFYVLYSGIKGYITPFTWVAIALVIGEGIVLLIFKLFCPLTILARRYSDSQADNFDIFLSNWLAMYNKLIFTSLFVIGFIIVLVRVVIQT